MAEERARLLAMTNKDDVIAALSHQNKAHFSVRLRNLGEAPAGITRRATLELPPLFVQQHSDKLSLEGDIVLEPVWREATAVVKLEVKGFEPNKRLQTYFSTGWKDFARSNNLEIGDWLIFHLYEPSKFIVYLFRRASAISVPRFFEEPANRSSTSELQIAPVNLTAGGNSPPQGIVDGSQPDVSHHWEAIPRKRGVAEPGDAGAVGSSSETLCRLKLRLFELELEFVQVSMVPTRPDQNPGYAENIYRTLLQVTEGPQPPVASMLSFVHRLEKFNVQDTAGNTSGARLEVPFSFVEAYGIQLQPQVRLQGTREDSPDRLVTCSHNWMQDPADREGRPPLSLGWGDFVRDNGLREGELLVFTLRSESYFTIREVHDLVVITK